MNPLLNLIVTHYDEPWELGKPFFDMIEHQKSVDLKHIAVTLVQDGEEYALPWADMLSQYHYKVKILTIPHSGTAVARNTALDKCTADWVMFCNFDDMLADIASLAMMTENFPVNDYDVIWMKIVSQCKWYTGHVYLNCIKSPNFSNTDGKMYRTQFLKDKHIRFFSKPRMHYELMFNAIVLAETQPFRIVSLTTEIYPYAKTFRQDSFKHSLNAFAEQESTILERERVIINELRKRKLTFAYKREVAKAICNEYYKTYTPDNLNDRYTYSPGFIDFYKQYMPVFQSLPQSDLDAIKSEAEIEQLELIQARYNEHKQEYYFAHDNVSFDEWIIDLNTKLARNVKDNPLPDPSGVSPVLDTHVKHVHDPVPDDIQYESVDNSPVVYDLNNNPRIVVYCGTYDVYLNMIASCKSLLCNTPVDKVYFLCEDDEFPYDLPDIVQTINVKNDALKVFDPDGPNFNNSWTYMCMVRALFPDSFFRYSKILSLDIDVVINDNVSDLWDYDLSGYYLAGVPEKQRQKSSADPLYINFGVVMMNLDKLRHDNLQRDLVNALNTKHLGCPEQDAYNQLCAGHILELPADYNYTTYSHITGDAQKERIIHYAGQKFWRHYSMVKQYSDLGWNEVMRRQNKLKEGEANAK